MTINEVIKQLKQNSITVYDTEPSHKRLRLFGFDVTHCDNNIISAYNKLAEDVDVYIPSNFTKMNAMFSQNEKITNLSFFLCNDFTVKDTSFMFYNCENLKELDLRWLNVSNDTYMMCMFKGCRNLKKITVNEKNASIIKNQLQEDIDFSNITFVIV